MGKDGLDVFIKVHPRDVAESPSFAPALIGGVELFFTDFRTRIGHTAFIKEYEDVVVFVAVALKLPFGALGLREGTLGKEPRESGNRQVEKPRQLGRACDFVEFTGVAFGGAFGELVGEADDAPALEESVG